jgi:hypothetical protein
VSEADDLRGSFDGTRLKAAERPGALDPVLQDVLAADPVSVIRAALAERPDLTGRVSRLLAFDLETFVRRTLASNPALDLPASRVLMRDPDDFVVSALALKTEHPEVLKELGFLTSRRVQRALVANAAVELHPSMALQALLGDVRGLLFVHEALRDAGIDPEVTSAFQTSWEGTLTELIDVARDFAA